MHFPLTTSTFVIDTVRVPVQGGFNWGSGFYLEGACSFGEFSN